MSIKSPEETRESDVEKHLVKQVKRFRGEVRKLQWIGRNGAPDRAVMLNGVHLVELKRPGAEPKPHQVREHIRLRRQGVKIYVLDSIAAVDSFIGRICGARV